VTAALVFTTGTHPVGISNSPGHAKRIPNLQTPDGWHCIEMTRDHSRKNNVDLHADCAARRVESGKDVARGPRPCRSENSRASRNASLILRQHGKATGDKPLDQHGQMKGGPRFHASGVVLSASASERLAKSGMPRAESAKARVRSIAGTVCQVLSSPWPHALCQIVDARRPLPPSPHSAQPGLGAQLSIPRFLRSSARVMLEALHPNDPRMAPSPVPPRHRHHHRHHRLLVVIYSIDPHARPLS
jgi:hypothetical protein